MIEDANLAPEEQTGSDSDALLARLKGWFRKDKEATAKWRRNAREDFDFVAGEQWPEEDKTRMKNLMRPMLTFNRVMPVVQSVSGSEIANRKEVRYIGRELGDAKPNEILTQAAIWFRDLSDADDEDSDAFWDSTVCGIGWTDSTLDFDTDPEGTPETECCNPLEIVWDASARKKNLLDKRRVSRVRRMSMAEAREMFPGIDPERLNASWAVLDDDDQEHHSNDPEDRYADDDNETEHARDEKEVCIVHMQWKETIEEYIVIDPQTGSEVRTDRKGAARASAIYTIMGVSAMPRKVKRKVVKEAYLGKDIIKGPEDALCPEHFRYNAITAYQNRRSGLFYGLVQQMRDPQKWANKWLSQAVDILQSQANGGIMMEKGAVENPRKFEKEWTNPKAIVEVADGTLSNPMGPRIQPRPQAQFPVGFYQLMEFAISSVRDVTGINIEMLGMREANQPASLEYQRRQAGMTILQPLFDNLKRYRREQGEVLLYIIQEYLSDGRLVRIVGQQGEQYVPLIRQADKKYDIIVDDAPAAPDQKERVWQFIGPMFMQLPPQLQMVFVDYAPLPETVKMKVKEAIQSVMPAQQQASELAQQKGQAEIGKAQAEIGKMQSEAKENEAEMVLDYAKAQEIMRNLSIPPVPTTLQ